MKAALAALLLVPCAAATAEELRLDQALELARAGHPSLRAASADVDAARARLLQAGLPLANPVLSGELARHTESGNPHLDRGVAIGQEVEVGGQRGLRVAAAEHDVDRVEDLLAEQARTLDAGVRRAFAGLVAAESRRDLAAEALAISQRILAITERRARAGDAGELEASLARIDAMRAERSLAAAETDRVRAATALASAIGAEADVRLEAVPEEPRPGPALEESALVAQALAARPDLAGARAERDRLSEQARAVHREGVVPNPVVRAFYRHELGSETIAGGEVAVPIPIWNRAQGTEAELLAAARRADAEADRLAREIPREVHLALARRGAAEVAWAEYRDEAMPAMAAAQALLERAAASGYLGLSELLTQRDRLLAVRAAAIAARLEFDEAEADLVEAVGGTLH
jgi:cobalt-zinc-cadmium efflux system outer membrane protein